MREIRQVGGIHQTGLFQLPIADPRFGPFFMSRHRPKWLCDGRVPIIGGRRASYNQLRRDSLFLLNLLKVPSRLVTEWTRKAIFMRKIVAVSLILTTTACANIEESPVFDVTAGQVVGAIAGAYVGGAIGAQFGGGMGQLISKSIGVVIGGGAGYVVGSLLDPSDVAYYNDNAQKTLSAQNDGVFTNWSNPETGNGGTFRATRSYTTGDGRYCREYRAAMAVAGTIENREGWACQQADGSWRSTDEDLG